MYVSFFIISCLSLIYMFRNGIIKMFNDYSKVSSLVSTRHKGNVNITLNTLYLLCCIFYSNLLQYMNNSVIKLDDNLYEVKYCINGRLYKIIIDGPKKGPQKILQIVANDSDDVTRDLLPFLGPRNDFHGRCICPQFFGYEKLLFNYYDGTEKSFSAEERVEL